MAEFIRLDLFGGRVLGEQIGRFLPAPARGEHPPHSPKDDREQASPHADHQQQANPSGAAAIAGEPHRRTSLARLLLGVARHVGGWVWRSRHACDEGSLKIADA
ncbi:MAG TPA: hypothetical protein VF218_00855 [Acidothermaceae bacterium]